MNKDMMFTIAGAIAAYAIFIYIQKKKDEEFKLSKGL